jgi:uncharacterized protein YjiS (DUF1127 family)
MKEMTAMELLIGAKAYRIINKLSLATAPAGELLQRVINAVVVWRQRAADRREMAKLLAYSDWELSDIGVTRADIRAEVEKFFWTA